MVLQVSSENLLKAFSLKLCIVSTQEEVVVTRQVKLSMLVQAAWCYDLQFLISRKLQARTHSQTHTQNTPINIIGGSS